MIVTERVIGIVKLVRLDLYGHGLACGAKAIQRQLDEEYDLEPLPSVRTIGRILAAEGLTYGRTGWYEGEIPWWGPMSSRQQSSGDRDVPRHGSGR